jgi:hypothetical protein
LLHIIYGGAITARRVITDPWFVTGLESAVRSTEIKISRLKTHLVAELNLLRHSAMRPKDFTIHQLDPCCNHAFVRATSKPL